MNRQQLERHDELNARNTREPVGDAATENVVLIPTVGEIFGDGAMIELIGGATIETPRLRLWDGTKETTTAVVKYRGLSYEASRINRSFLRELRLPSHSTSPGSTRELLAEICKLMTNFVGLNEKPALIVGRFVLSTWLIEAVQLAPALAITGPDVTGGNRLLQLLHCLCRHGVRLSGVTPAGLCSLPSGMGITFLISQPNIGDRLSKLLRVASKRDHKIPHRGGLSDLFGAQAIQSESIGGTEFSADRFVQIPMIPANAQIPRLQPEEQDRIACEFQPKLLGFRCAMLTSANKLQFDPSRLSLPLRPLALSFAAATPDDPELQDAVVDLLQEADEEARSSGWTQLSVVAVEAVQVACFESLGESVYIGELAKIAQEILIRRFSELEIDAGTLGRCLRLLGFRPEPRDTRGVKLKLTEEVQRRALQLARDLGVPMAEVRRSGRVPQTGDDSSISV